MQLQKFEITQDSIQTASPRWKGDNALPSPFYKDVYFSKAGAIPESRYVFLRQNRLPHRWLTQSHFSICEAGFGTGLNFLLTLDFWMKFAPKTATLSYTGVEKHPITKDRLAAIHQVWPSLAPLSERLLSVYPDPTPGAHLLFPDLPGVRLHLVFADIRQLALHLTEPVDAWYLDGFSPKTNPAMWSQDLFTLMGNTTRPGGTFATFTAVGDVRRGLTENGFLVEKAPGFGTKRDMLRGRFRKEKRTS